MRSEFMYWNSFIQILNQPVLVMNNRESKLCIKFYSPKQIFKTYTLFKDQCEILYSGNKNLSVFNALPMCFSTVLMEILRSLEMSLFVLLPCLLIMKTLLHLSGKEARMLSIFLCSSLVSNSFAKSFLQTSFKKRSF